MVFYSATTPDFNLTWVAMQGSTREQILTKEEIRPICHELGSLSFGLAWRAGITNALQTHSMDFHGMTCSSKIRDFFFHSGMPESSAKISPISQYAWELMNMLEDTRPQSQVWSKRPIAVADSLFWIFWWQGFCKEARMKRLSWRKITDTSGVSPFCQDAKIM